MITIQKIAGEGAGCVTIAFTDLPLEDLIRVERWVRKQFT